VTTARTGKVRADDALGAGEAAGERAPAPGDAVGERSPAPEDAAAAGLRYVDDDAPGIARRRAGKGFSYRLPTGEPVRDRETLARIRSLAIPPAWTDVWICRSPDGHIQATGRDARGRKQYRYHPRWREQRDEGKFERVIEFANALDAIRARVDADLALPGLPREKVLAAVIRLLELTLIRVGNEEYARLNSSFGLSTLKDRHARIEGTAVRFRFKGKAGITHEVGLRDRRLATIVKRCRDLRGQDLFQYVEPDGTVRDVRSDDVNAYIREVSGGPFSAKDFRTWAGTVLAFRALRSMEAPSGETAAKKRVVAAVRETADRLGNTPAVARSSYVHPAVLETYLDEGLREVILNAVDSAGPPSAALQPEEEKAVLALLRQRLEADAGRVHERARRTKRESQAGSGPKGRSHPARAGSGGGSDATRSKPGSPRRGRRRTVRPPTVGGTGRVR
jgi:DNA topoisomerase-1